MDILTATVLGLALGAATLYALYWTVRAAVLSALRAHDLERSSAEGRRR